ncbi:hypothetical protein A5686_06215 [Mycobacterium sp. E2479]|nr:hypothetical protein A5686_06215 [Mycobacterium sp. E2479]
MIAEQKQRLTAESQPAHIRRLPSNVRNGIDAPKHCANQIFSPGWSVVCCDLDPGTDPRDTLAEVDSRQPVLWWDQRDRVTVYERA